MRATGTTIAAGTILVLAASALRADQRGTLLQPTPPVWEHCGEMHDFYVNRFERAVGFGSARMGTPDMLDRSGVLDLGRDRYRVERLELVGLLREKPVVHVLGRHEQEVRYGNFGPGHATTIPTGKGQTRELTEFEAKSVSVFRAGGDIHEAPGKTDGRVCSGALRAKANCVSCHEGKKVGDVMGAFTYGLRAIERDRP